MKRFSFSSLYYIGINADASNSENLYSEMPEKIIVNVIKNEEKNSRALPLIASYFYYYDHLINENVLLKYVLSDLDDQKDRNLLIGILKKTDKIKYSKIIEIYRDLNAPYYLTKICKLKIENGLFPPDKDLLSIGVLSPGFELEKESKFLNLEGIKKVNKELAKRINSSNLNVTKDKFFGDREFAGIDADLSAIDKHYVYCYLGINKHEKPIKINNLPEEIISTSFKKYETDKEFKKNVLLWISKYREIINFKLMKKLLKKEEIGAGDILKIMAQSKFEHQKSRNDYALLYGLNQQNIFIRNRITMGVTNKADIASLITLDKDLNPYTIAKRLNINYEISHRNFNNLKLFNSIVHLQNDC